MAEEAPAGADEAPSIFDDIGILSESAHELSRLIVARDWFTCDSDGARTRLYGVICGIPSFDGNYELPMADLFPGEFAETIVEACRRSLYKTLEDAVLQHGELVNTLVDRILARRQAAADAAIDDECPEEVA